MAACTRRRILTAALPLLGCRRPALPPLTAGTPTSRREVFAELLAQVLERSLGFSVARQSDLGGGLAAHEALLAGRVDLIIECTGFALTSILRAPADPRREVAFERVRLEYAQRFQVRWMDPLGFDDGFVLVLRRDFAQRAGLTRLSDAAAYQPGWRLAAPSEFLIRPDGMPALMKTYSLRLLGGPETMTVSGAYRALREGKVTLIAAHAADGELLAEDMLVLEDDRHAFPPNQAAVLAREQALASHRGMEAALQTLSGRISQQLARKLVADAAARAAREAAAAFIREQLGPPGPSGG